MERKYLASGCRCGEKIVGLLWLSLLSGKILPNQNRILAYFKLEMKEEEDLVANKRVDSNKKSKYFANIRIK